MAEISVIGATPKVIDALKKASMLPGRDMSYGDEGKDISFQQEEQVEVAPSGEPVYVASGAALPAVISNSSSLPYEVTVYPNGFGNNSGRYSAASLLPVALAYSNAIPTGTRMVVFTSYLPALGGDQEYRGYN